MFWLFFFKQFQKKPSFGSSDQQGDYMKTLQNDIELGYVKLRQENKSQRDKVESKKKTIFASIAVGATVLGAVGSFAIAGPLGLGLFATFAEAGPAMLGGVAAAGMAGGGIGGLGVGAITKKWLPRKWFGEQSALKKLIKRTKHSRKDKFDEETAADDNVSAPPPNNIATLSDHVAPTTTNHTESVSDNIAVTDAK